MAVVKDRYHRPLQWQRRKTLLKHPSSRWVRKQKCNTSEQIEAPKVKPPTAVVYTGMPTRVPFMDALEEGLLPERVPIGNELGGGGRGEIYFTYDPAIARAYVQRNGIILACDWSKETGGLSKTILTGSEWKREIKRHSCKWQRECRNRLTTIRSSLLDVLARTTPNS